MSTTSIDQPTEMEAIIANQIRLRVERMATKEGAWNSIAARLDLAPLALRAILQQPWTVAMAVRIADRLEFDELQAFAKALK